IAYGEQPGYEGEKISDECAYVVCAPPYKAWLEESSYAEPINKLVLVGSEALWDQWQKLSARALDGPGTISDSSIVCKRAAIAGHGLSIQRHSLVQHELNDGQLVKLDNIALEINEGYYLLRPTGRELSEAQQTVWDWALNNL
ncbi:MAG: LysR substrate-binding domain-containing protein, partial [Granulosicoccaceae bacterium]